MKVFTMLFLTSCLFSHQSHSGEISLSFDDSPTNFGGYFSDLQRTKELAKQLKNVSVNEVVFFSNSVRLTAEGKERLEIYAQHGHIIANHSHGHLDLHEVGANKFIEDVKLAHKLLSPLANFVRWFRFPYLRNGNSRQQRSQVKQALDRMGYRHGYVTVDNYDWYMSRLFQNAARSGKKIHFDRLKRTYINNLWQTIVFYDDMAKAVLKRSPRHVLLLHENDLAALFVGDLVKHIRSKGWRVISPRRAYKDPIAKMNPDVNFAQGLIPRLAKAANYKGSLAHRSESTFYIKGLFKKENVFE